MNELYTIHYQDKFGPSTDSIVNAALVRHIPVIPINDDSLVQLGYGSKQHRIEATLTERTSYMAVELAETNMPANKPWRLPGCRYRRTPTFADRD